MDRKQQDSIEQVINLLRSNTQNIFHLEKDLPIDHTLLPAPSSSSSHRKHPLTVAHKYNNLAPSLYPPPPHETRPVSHSDPPSYVPSILDSEPQPSPSPQSRKSKKERDKEKRGSKLAPVMPFTLKRGSGVYEPVGGGEILDLAYPTLPSPPPSLEVPDNTETMIALNACGGGKAKKKASSLSSLSLPPAPALSAFSSPGYFDKFMNDFYPDLPPTPMARDSPTDSPGKDYHRLIGLPPTESIIAKFRCAHRGKLLKQGKLFITQHYVCFYSSLFLTKKLIRFEDVINIRKMTYAFLLSNAVKIVTLQKKYYFGLFVDRNVTFQALVSQWVKCGGKVSASVQEDLNSKEKDENAGETSPSLRFVSPPFMRRSRFLTSSTPSARTLFDPQGNPAPPSLSPPSLSPPSSPPHNSSASSILRNSGATSLASSKDSPTGSHSPSSPPSSSIYAPVKLQYTNTISRKSIHLFAEDKVTPINKWLTEKANEDARYRVLKGVVFGASLENLPLSEKGDSYLSNVPTFVADVLGYLQTAGLHVRRLFAQFVDRTEVGALRASVEAGRADFFRNATNPKLLAALLKQFLIELPVPVLSNPDIVFCAEIDDYLYHRSCLRSFVYSLPFHHRTTLNALISFFRIIANYRNINEASPQDLASIFGPILLNKPLADLMFLSESSRIIEQLILHYDEIFSDKEKAAVYVMKRGFQVVKHATLDLIILKLVDPYYGDADFVDVVIITHNLYFIKTEDLVNRLISIYDNKSGPQLWKHKLRLRILYLLTLLIPHLPPSTDSAHHKGAPPSSIAWFYARHHNSSATSKEELHLLEMLVHTQKPAAPLEPDVALSKPMKIKAKYQPLDLAIQDLACQMAIIDLKYFKELPLEELMAKNFSKPEKSPHFQAMVQLFNRWSMWVGTEIFSCPDVAARAVVFEKLISLAELLRELRDFHGAYAITAGLGHFSIARLHMTMEKVNKKAKATLTSLQELFNSESNHKSYRDILQRSSPPLVPYLGLYSKDLFVIEENLGPNVLASGMVNFEKMRSVHTALKAVKHLQSFSYQLPEVPALAKLMLEKPLMDEDEMDAKSKEFEPRKPRPVSMNP